MAVNRFLVSCNTKSDFISHFIPFLFYLKNNLTLVVVKRREIELERERDMRGSPGFLEGVLVLVGQLVVGPSVSSDGFEDGWDEE